MMLGRYLARKLAGEQNIEEARRWTERAVAQGMQEAKADLAALPPAPQADPDGTSAARESAARAAGDGLMAVGGTGSESAIVTLARTAMDRGLAALDAQDLGSALRW